MSSSRNIEQALAKAKNHLLLRLMATLLLCLLLVELIVGAIFFFDLYQTEKKIMTSMSAEYQRILTYDSPERLTHVLEANPHRLIENNIAAYVVNNQRSNEAMFVAGDTNVSNSLSNLSGADSVRSLLEYEIDDSKMWLESFVVSPYMSLRMTGEDNDFWLVLDNRARDHVAFNQWLMTLYALVALLVVTAVFTRKIIQNAMSPLITLGDLLDQLQKGQLELKDM